MVQRTESSAFALATPLRIEELLRIAVHQALGMRAPDDKRERNLRTTIAGFVAGRFVVDVNGRRFRSLDDVVVCSGSATLRFFSSDAERSLAHPTR
jgi:hypothetical protein